MNDQSGRVVTPPMAFWTQATQGSFLRPNALEVPRRESALAWTNCRDSPGGDGEAEQEHIADGIQGKTGECGCSNDDKG